MPSLCTHQTRQVDNLLRIAKGGAIQYPSTLLLGPPGAGKRTVSRVVADQLGMEFIEVPVNDTGERVAERLFGARSEIEPIDRNGPPPGELGIQSPCLIYLSGFQGLDINFAQEIHRLIARKIYYDKSGHVWILSPDIWIVAALSYPARTFNITVEHWVCSAFQRRLEVAPPTVPEDLLQICKNIMQEHGRFQEIDKTAIALLKHLKDAPDYLHTLRRWLEAASYEEGKSSALTGVALRRAMLGDIKWLLPRIPYRGREISLSTFECWWTQFPEKVQPLALHLIGQIAEYYYIGQRQYFDALDDLIRRSGIPRNARVTFCKWQLLGKSSPRIAHALKNQSGWSPTAEVDFDRPQSSWPNVREEGPHWFVFADDFVGSGNTMTSLCRDRKKLLSRLLERYPNSDVRILVVAGFEDGVRRARSELMKFGDRVQIIASHLFNSGDKCFSEDSRIIGNVESRRLFRKFCIDIAKSKFRRLPARFRLGYESVGSIIVFFDTVPNNSLPILWYDQDPENWVSLFPASGLPHETIR